MLNRLLKGALIVGLTGLLAACASVSGAVPGVGGRRPVETAVVRDPAPIVSGTMRPYQIRGRWYRPAEDPGYNQVGMASWYGDQFNGRPTATGERFDMHAMTAAHKTLPLPSMVEVTNMANGRTAVLRVNDRGPFVDDRIIDLSRGAAEDLGLLSRGVGEVRVRYLGPAPRLGGGRLQQASTTQVAPAPPPVEQARVPEPSRFWVQAGSFADPLAARLSAESLGGGASVASAEIDGRRLFRVMVGPWSDANAAEQARLSIMARGVRDALLISGG